MTDRSRIRNFSIIAHIDHGKSTLADRFIQMCGGLAEREMAEQVLDSMELERERGITIKAQTAALEYRSKSGETYQLNLIDTPGHVDFSYEVSRSLAACEGAVLVVDASQGVEAQTVANCYTAIEQGVEVIPVLNKIDLPSADAGKAIQEIEDVIGIAAQDAIRVSAKTGENVDAILEAVIARVPAPQGDPDGRAAGADHRLLVRQLCRRGDAGAHVFGHAAAARQDPADEHRRDAICATTSGCSRPKAKARDVLAAGEVGYVTAGIKELRAAKVGDTLTLASKPAAKPLPGFKEIKPQVFAGLYPVEASEYEALRDALEKLHLNDASFHYEPETSQALGFGFRCGFLGLLHMDIVQERLEREYGMHLITTAPSVVYEVKLRDGTLQQVSNPSRLPPVETIEEFREPIMACKIFVPQEYVGPVISLCTDKRGTQTNMHYSARHVVISYDLPLNEVVLDFFDRLKSMTRGYGSLDYEFKEYRAADMVRLDILVNGEKVDALSSMVHRSASQHRGRELVTKLRSLIPRQMFDVAVQAAIGGHIIARENVKALRKNVIAKCYGGDITRKRKLLDKQKEGKKRMKQVGAVEIPQEAFLAVLQRGDR